MKWDSFLPRSESKVVFVIVMVCYTWTLTGLLNAILSAFHFNLTPAPFLTTQRDHPFLCAAELLGFSPIVESLVLIVIIEGLRFGRAAAWVQVIVATITIGVLHSASVSDSHSVSWGVRGISIAPGFAIQAMAYLFWRPSSIVIASGIVLSIHVLHNLIPALAFIGYGIRHL